MTDQDIPILKKSSELYKIFHTYRKLVPKAVRFTIYNSCEALLLEVIKCFLEAGYTNKGNKLDILERASVKLNTLRFLIRLMKEIKVFDLKKYTTLQEMIDEIGRMLGGWIRSTAAPR